MDFLKTREKAKERAATASASPAPDPAEASPPANPEPQGESERATPERPGEAERPAADAVPAADPVLTEIDVLEGELAARLQGVAPPADERFTTWRPGTGEPPPLVPPVGPEVHVPSEEDFALVPVANAWATQWGAREPAARPPAADPADPLDDFFYREDETSEGVPTLGAPAVEKPAGSESIVLEEYLTFLLGPEEYAVSIGRVREVLRAPPITEVPRAPPDVLGVVTVRGDVVPVFDPRGRLGLPPSASDPEGAGARIVIVDAGEGPCGLLVDAVASVVRLKPGTIEPCPQGIAVASAESIEGLGRVGDRLFMVLDLGALLRRATSGAADDGRPDASP